MESVKLTPLPADAGVLICGHGSRAEIAAQEFGLLVDALQARYPGLPMAYGFLEYSSPNLHMALDSLTARGVKKIYALPGMLFAATHAKNDIPSVLTTYLRRHPGLEIRYGRELGLHAEMIAAFQLRILEALGRKEIPAAGTLYDTMLVTVGRGTSVASANAQAARLCRIVTENLGFGWAETVYSGVTFPSVGVGLEMALRLGFKKIVVAPYFLFSGHLIGRIHAYTNQVAAAHPQVAFLMADYLRDSGHVLNTLTARLEQLAAGDTQPVDALADFQRRLARGEVELHHHHAEFKSPDRHGHAADHVPDHDHDHEQAPEQAPEHGHAHRHTHAPYVHIGHPLGPRSMIDEQVCCCFMRQFPQDIIDQERRKKAALNLSPPTTVPQCTT